MLLNVGVSVVNLFSQEVEAVIAPAQAYNLDFDDAYQYATAERYDLTIVSFDTDFDRTERGRCTPNQVNS